MVCPRRIELRTPCVSSKYSTTELRAQTTLPPKRRTLYILYMASEPKDDLPVDPAIVIAELTAKIAILEGDVRSRDAEIDRLLGRAKKPDLHKLDAGATSAFDRPYGGG